MNQELNNIIAELRKEYPSLYKRAENNKKQLRILASFYNLGKHTVKGFNKKILEEAMALSEQHAEPRNLNDFYSILLYASKGVKGFKKQAYPQNPLIISDDYEEQFDINKWAKLVYKIYDAVLSNDMTLPNAIDYYAETLDKKSEEDFKFKQWIKYHLSGDGHKYAEKEKTMKKQSDFQFGLNSSNFYYPDTIPMPERERGEKSVKERLENEIEDAEKKKQLQDWKRKLDGAIRRIDKLIRSIDDPTVTEELFNSLHNFNMTVQKAKSSVTASDIAYRTANSFRKVGFDQGYDILSKTAQEIETAPEEIVDEIPPAVDESPADLQEDAGATQPSTDPVERVYENTSGAKEGEYEALSQDIDLSDAISKLEEIAARLSDRRVIRLLAEFDIMLDKIGIASMFPELAESQSKLIDGYSYALVRVTKMLGMLSSGKSLGELSSARKSEMTRNVRKEVDKTLQPKPEEDSKSRGEEAISEEFQEAEPTPEPEPEVPPTQ